MLPFCRSIKAFWVGFPGWIYSNRMFLDSHHSCSRQLINSGPLLHLMHLGMPLSAAIRSSVRITRRAGREVSISMDKDSRLKSLITLKRRNLLPSVSASLIKSMLQTSLGASGIASASMILAGSLRLGLRRMLSFISVYIRYTFL